MVVRSQSQAISNSPAVALQDWQVGSRLLRRQPLNKALSPPPPLPQVFPDPARMHLSNKVANPTCSRCVKLLNSTGFTRSNKGRIVEIEQETRRLEYSEVFFSWLSRKQQSGPWIMLSISGILQIVFFAWFKILSQQKI